MDVPFVYASISMGAKEYLEESIDALMNNASINQFVFYDGTMENIIEPEIEKIYVFIDAEFPETLYAQVEKHPMKIVIRASQEERSVLAYPLEPYLTKKGYGTEYQKCDLGFYIEQILCFCDHFHIYELYTRLRVSSNQQVISTRLA